MTAVNVVACVLALAFVLPAADDDPPVPAARLGVREKVDPVYPRLAARYRIQGTVRFTAIVNKDGHVESLHLVSGHPLLVPAAREAARQWTFFPLIVRGEPRRAVIQFDVNFHLGPNHTPPPRQREPEDQVRT